jgi:hypothetical protein
MIYLAKIPALKLKAFSYQVYWANYDYPQKSENRQAAC